MIIVETSHFTRRVRKLLEDDQYRELQEALVDDPTKGTVIRGSGGIRKIRWEVEGRGKSGGVRVIYYWATAQHIVLMLLIYAKNEQDNLTPEQLKLLRTLVEAEFK